MGKFTDEGFEFDDGTLVSPPKDSEIRVTDLDGNTMDVYREGQPEYAEWNVRFLAERSGLLTIRKLIRRLQLCRNLDAIACLSVDGLTYSAIVDVTDMTHAPKSDGDMGNALLTLDPESEVSMALNQLADIVRKP